MLLNLELYLGDMRSQVSDQASHGSIQCRDIFKFEESKVSILLRLLGQPIDYEHDIDSCVLSGGLMLDGCHSTSSEPQSANPPHYGRWCWYCLIIVWWSTTRFRSDSNQNFCLANPKTSTASRRSRSLVFAVCSVAPSCKKMAGPAAGGCQSVAQSKCREPRKIPPSIHVCSGSRPMGVCNYGKGTTTPWWRCLRRHVVVGHRQNGDA